MDKHKRPLKYGDKEDKLREAVHINSAVHFMNSNPHQDQIEIELDKALRDQEFDYASTLVDRVRLNRFKEGRTAGLMVEDKFGDRLAEKFEFAISTDAYLKKKEAYLRVDNLHRRATAFQMAIDKGAIMYYTPEEKETIPMEEFTVYGKDYQISRNANAEVGLDNA